jgi:hypothetical protein
MAKLVALNNAMDTVKKWAAQAKALTFEDNFQTQVQISNLENGHVLLYSDILRKWLSSDLFEYKQTSATGSTTINTNSYASLMSVDINVVPTDVILAIATINCSSGTINRYAGFRLNIEDTDADRWHYFTAGLTTGDHVNVPLFRLATGLSGVITVDVQWRTGVAATTIYATNRNLWVVKIASGKAL